MDLELLLQLLTQLSFFLILLLVLRDVVRHPNEANVHIALFFGALAVAVGAGSVLDLLGIAAPGWFETITRSLVVALPYLLLRIVSDFSDVPRTLLRAAELGLVLCVGAVLTWDDLPPAVVVAIVAYFVGLHLYAVAHFLREAVRAHGVTRRRMQAAAGGTLLFSVAILIAGIRSAVGAPEVWAQLPLQITLLGAALAYFTGFAPPALLRRAWQEPGLRGFLRRVVELPWLEDLAATVRAIEEGAAASFGAEGASIALWDPESGSLVVPGMDSDPRVGRMRPGEFIAGRAFQERRAIFAPNAAKEDPANADVYMEWDARAIVSAPIVAGGEPLGVLSVYGPRAPVFAADDLDLVQLLADQAAIILEGRRLLDEAAEVRAREEAMRLRDDFLSAAAHDLRTPLQAIMGFAEVLEWKATARPEEPVDVQGLRRISHEAERLSNFVSRLLDAAQGDTGSIVAGEREEAELGELARGVCARQTTASHPCVVQADSTVVAEVDRLRISQVLENLIENGKKYSPDGGEITVRLWQEPGPNGGKARIAVRDRGIGIPSADRPHVFERFRRAGNVNDRRFSGMGLGLYICRLIAEQHGGRIWLESEVGAGSTFHVALPIAPPSSEEE